MTVLSDPNDYQLQIEATALIHLDDLLLLVLVRALLLLLLLVLLGDVKQPPVHPEIRPFKCVQVQQLNEKGQMVAHIIIFTIIIIGTISITAISIIVMNL